MDLGVLLSQVVTNPITLIERVLQGALGELERADAFAMDGDQPPGELLATALGSRLARMIVSDAASPDADWSTVGLREDGLSQYSELADRDAVLAAALGACHCWGRHADCSLCQGTGTPGWMLPDEQLFASYVRPAVKAISNLGSSTDVPEREASSHRKEDRDVEYLTRPQHDAHTAPGRW
jgi:hypothetical protein